MKSELAGYMNMQGLRTGDVEEKTLYLE